MRTSEYPYCRFGFDEWNPVQEKCLELFTQDCNVLVGASVASGKTAIAEAIMGYETLSPDCMAVYVSPLKSIGLEKYNAWREHPTFALRGVVLLDGDHRCGEEELMRSGVVVTTVESLHMAARRGDIWLTGRLRVLVFDEAHLLGSPNRGAIAEGMLMDVTQLVPSARVVCLSGTIGNTQELARWLKALNGKETRYVSSTWRPTTLEKGIQVASSLYEKLRYIERECVSGRKTLVFVHSRKLGEILQRHLRSRKIACALFHAGMSFDRREASLERFRGKTDVLIATSSLSMGVTL